MKEKKSEKKTAAKKKKEMKEEGGERKKTKKIENRRVWRIDGAFRNSEIISKMWTGEEENQSSEKRALGCDKRCINAARLGIAWR